MKNGTLFLFQYNGKIIAKAKVHLINEWFGTNYYTSEIEVFEEPITFIELKQIWKEFKKFNSVAQKIPIES